MKRHAYVSVVLVALVSAACQRPAARSVDAGAPSATPPAAVAATPAPAEAAPQPATAVPTEAAPASRPRSAAAAEAGVPPTPPAAAKPVVEPVAAPEPTPDPTPEPTPKPTPTPKPRIVASGTALPIVLQQPVSTKTAKAEDPVLAELAADVSVDGDVLLPRGSEVRGHVVSAVRSGRVKGKAQLVVAWDEVRVGSASYKISATGFDVTAGSSKGKDAKIAGGAAAAGAIIGAIADGGSGALKGGLIGGAAGGAAVLATRGAEVELPSGGSYTITLEKSLRLR